MFENLYVFKNGALNRRRLESEAWGWQDKRTLIQARADIINEAEQNLAIATEEGRRLSEEERRFADAAESEIKRLDDEIRAAKLKAEREKTMPTRGDWSSGSESRTTTRPSGHRFESMFPGVAISNDGWESQDEFFKTIHHGLNDARLMAAHTEGTPAGGGFSVPSQYVREWLDSSLQKEIVRPRCRIYPMKHHTLRVPGWDGFDHSDGDTHGGIKGAWLAEDTTATDDNASMLLLSLTAKKLALFGKASNELIADGLNFDEQLGKAMIDSVGWSLDWAFLNGTGAGQPLGIINADCKITVDKEGAQPAATILYENIKKMFARMAPSSVNNAVWLAHPSTIPQLLGLNQPVGTGGAVIPVMSESNGEFRMLTRPILFTEHCRDLGTEGDLYFVDLGQYIVGMRKEASIEKSQHVGWQSDTTGYRCILRVDGQPAWPEALTPRYGTDTLSPIVTLETRS